MIDLRSDTATRPTEGMRAAIAAAEVGDEQKREDPTVNALQERAAALLGQEAALFVPTATMANQIALKLHTRPGDVLVAERHAHVVIYEYGGAAAHAGLLVEPIAGRAGRFGVAELEAASMPSTKAADQRATLVALENTHNSSGGRCWPLPELRAVTQAARERGLATHLDGARLLNAAVATGVPPAELGGLFDTVTLCLSKGLGCPLGALLAGSSRPPASTPSTTTSSGWPTTTHVPAGSPRAGTRPASPSTSSRSRRTSSSWTSPRSVSTATTRSPCCATREWGSRRRSIRPSPGPSRTSTSTTTTSSGPSSSRRSRCCPVQPPEAV